MLGMRHRCTRPLVDRYQTHPGHQPPDPLAANRMSVLPQVPHHSIAVLPVCDPRTLRKHFDARLSFGDARATAKTSQTLCSRPVAGDTACSVSG